MRVGQYVSSLSILLFAGQALAQQAAGHDATLKHLAKRSEQEARQLMEPSTESLKDAAANVYDDLKEIGGDFADQAEEYLEELFPGVAEADAEDKDEDSDAARVEEDVLDSSKPLEHVDDDDDAVNRHPAIVTTTTTQIPEFAKGHGHHKNKNGTHHRPGHKNKHNSTHGNDTDAPVFEPERYFTEPIITGLLVSFLVFIPLVAMGIAALSSIQVPPYLMAVSKTAGVSQSKKEQ
ncbi:hypothetical protein HD553DRAFT_8644 [Filobasidium floriforme]|uniref:uncharacterized protein n=1 Tax=Filobasidium floriforme TaxID=5210 RepID=UPI001E8ED3C8|nr:uncharacterized protein HD553DRAFT_8644 [Filobasidium floriforme]KAH8090557.1 hypothetical protein HD553DRAFT_8644 [Filobasidium floriforme]